MSFNSLEFFVFFALVYALYLVLPHRAQNRMLLVASYVFYGWWDWRFLSLIAISTVVDYCCGLRMSEAREGLARRRWLLLSLASNLGLLGFFKYYDFFVTSAEGALAGLGVDATSFRLDLVLPVGISFYTFQTLSYTLDIYRGTLKPTRDFLDFALFVAFFPQLVAGPIERASRLLPQVTNPRTIAPEQFRDGLYLIGWGLFKKVLIADRCAVIANQVFANHAAYSGFEQLLAVYAFAFQIYGDFSGYSDIARGLAKLMGFELMTNFDLPYFSRNPSEFWRRWHISLSSWLRDYLYISLGGNRGSRFNVYRNLMITMVLGGLWHGAHWTMVLWGVYQGSVLVIHRFYRTLRPGKPASERSPIAHALTIAFFFQVTCYGWLIFRAESVAQIGDFTLSMLRGVGWGEHSGEMLSQLSLLAVPLALIQLYQYRASDLLLWLRARPALRIVTAATMAGLALAYWVLFQSALGGSDEFIYFQF